MSCSPPPSSFPSHLEPQDIAAKNPLALSLARLLVRGHAKIDPQFPAIDFFLLEHFHAFYGALDVNKVGVSKTSRLSRSSVNCHSHVNDIFDASEQLVQVAIGHFEGHVPNEQGLARWIGGLGLLGPLMALLNAAGGEGSKLAPKAATLEDFLVHRFDCVGGSFSRFKVNIAESEINTLMDKILEIVSK